MEAKVAAVALLLSFSAALFLRGALANLLLSALDVLDGGGGSLLDLLVSRRSTVLLCHAVLLLVLRDAGILSGLARRKRMQLPRPGGSLTAEAARCTAPALPGPARVGEPEDTKEIILVEKWTSDGHLDHRRVHRAAVEGDRSSVLGLGRGAAVAHGDDKSRDMGRAIVGRDEGETEEESVVDDEMNRRFDRFIADTRTKMQLESLQPPSKAVSATGKERVPA